MVRFAPVNLAREIHYHFLLCNLVVMLGLRRVPDR